LAARSPLAKLTRPKLYGALARPRLFALLDEAMSRPIVWVSAAPGAGKTTLVASYLETRRLRHLWYQCDIGDADSATFVHYLRIAARPLAGNAALKLPLFTSEPQQNLARFARGFARDVFALLPHPCVVVLDNFHEPRTRREQRAALAQALDEVPEQITIVVVSRSDPPPEFARLAAGGRIARVDEAQLRCTEDEAEAILGDQRFDRQHLSRIYRQSDGWVAALVLLREHFRRRNAVLDESLGEGKDAIFQYFASEIFSGARPRNQRVLMLSAISPSITPQEAIALTGNEDAPRLLEYLYRHHLFIDRRRGEQLTYHYHALFREFLLEELRKRVPQSELRAATSQAAHQLSARGQQSEALILFREIGEWPAIHSLVRAHALEWARQGRSQALSDWIEMLPADVRESDPWLAYWFGRAWIFAEPQRGRPAIERAYEAFQRTGDQRGEALALSAIVNSYYYEWATFAPLDRWLPKLKDLLGERASTLDQGSELRAQAALLVALLLRKPEDDALEQCAQRLDALIDAESDLNVRVMAASTLFNYINWKTGGETAAALVARIEPIVVKPEVTPLMQVWWRTHLSFWHYTSGRYKESTAVITDARTIAERYGLETYLFDIDHAEASALINKGDHAAAKARLDEMERRLSPARRMQWPFYHHLRSVLEQRLGHGVASANHAERAVALVRELDLPSLQMPHFLARLAQARAALGDRDGAMAAVDEAIERASPLERKTFEHRRILLEIEADMSSGDLERVATGLRTVLADHRLREDYVFMRSRPDLAARLANYALQEGIEPEFVRTLIERDALVAPADARPAWPFRLRIRVLGGFELSRDGEEVRSSGKAQQRPLDLLKLVVSLGGKDVDADYATAALWPDADGAAAKNSFDSALFRLRKLLDIENAIVLTAGQLSLARSLVWTDVFALDAAIDIVRSELEASAAIASLARAARQLLDAYPGPLLGSDESAWIAKPRDALRGRFVRTLVSLGTELERRREWTTAIDVYRRGLEVDNLAESFYRGLMRSLAATGDHAEALNAFRRCRDLLSIVLGMKPSADTDRLYREIVAGRGNAM
jgi:ATP/maltotriose-dependent transcriptional regulator MalT/DNA-binding SARP family transcriptional activator